MNIINVTDASFDEVIEKNSLVVIDFWAEWCGPCKSFAKVVDKIAVDYPDVIFGKVDIEKERGLAEEFQIRSIPSIMIVRDQVVVYADSGSLSAASLVELLEKAKALKAEDIQ